MGDNHLVSSKIPRCSAVICRFSQKKLTGQPHDSSGALASGLFLSGVRSIHAARFQFVDHDIHFQGTQSHPTMSRLNKLNKLSKLGMRPYCTFLQQQVAT
jgi:hypothetical protein